MKILTLLLLLLSAASCAGTQNVKRETNYDESKVPTYVLPDLLTATDGTPIKSSKEWEMSRRDEILELFSSQMYGRTPQDMIDVRYEVLRENPNDMGGKATSKQVLFTFTSGATTLEALLLIYIPNDGMKQHPVFVSYNYKGNHSTTFSEDVLYSPSFSFVKEKDDPDWIRGNQVNRWCYDKIIDRGYAVATMCYHDIFPDKQGFLDRSVLALFPDYLANMSAPDAWQAIGAWAWGSSRIVDFLEGEDWVDQDKIAIMGHSRQGKAALWAGAQDERFSVVISNDSGAGGAALSKREFGETIADLVAIKPYWFCPAYANYAGDEKSLPFDQHFLVALMAPRKVYIASAVEDTWADPKGEFLAAYHAAPVFELYGLKGLASSEMPELDQPLMQDVVYHIRTGIHDVVDYDWERFMDFCDIHFQR